MQPQSPVPPTPPSSIDYLNQISAPTPQKTLNPIVLWGAIAGVLLFTVIIFMMALSGGTNNADRMTTIAARLSALKTVSKDATENIQGSDLRTLNSSLGLTLTNITRDMDDSVTVLKASTNEKDARVVAVSEQTTEMTDNLEDARLNGVYGRTYAREMAYTLKTLHSEMSDLYASTQKESVRTFLKDADTSLTTFTESFANYNGS